MNTEPQSLNTSHSMTSLRFGEQTLLDLLSSLELLAVICDPQGRILWLNPYFERTAGYLCAEVARGDFFELFIPEQGQSCLQQLLTPRQETTDRADHCTTPLRTRSGEHRTVYWTKSVSRDESGTLLTVILVGEDISDQLTTRMLYATSDADAHLFSSLLKYNPDVITLIDGQGRRRYVSPNVERIFGYSTEEILCQDIYFNVHPEDIPLVQQRFAEVVSQPDSIIQMEARARDASGEWRVYEVIGWNQIHNPALCGVVVSIRDVTERKELDAQRLQLEKQMMQWKRLESLAVLTGGLAHEFNNLMTTVLGFASLSAMQLAMDSPLRQYMRSIEDAAGRAAEICRQMLEFSGESGSTFSPLNVSTLLADCEEMLQSVTASTAKLELHLAPDLQLIDGDASQLRQAILGLLVNAVESVPSTGGFISIRTCNSRITEQSWRAFHDADRPRPGDYVLVEISDNGCGMNEAIRDHIFDPFFTTKFRGRGLGLAAVHGIVRSHRGAITVTSTPGQGSTFRLFFPVRHERRSSGRSNPLHDLSGS